MAGGLHCKDKESFIRNLRLINHRAGVEPEIIDLLEAYAGLRLERDDEVCFFDNDINIKDKKIEAFLSKNSHLDHRILNFLASYFMEMKIRGLKCILTSSHLAHLLNLSADEMNWLANDGKNHYRHFTRKKRDGSTRDIFTPRARLKEVQRRILDDILYGVRLNSHAHGFRIKKSIITNAARHIDKNIVIKMDAKDFFPSITFQRVSGMFASLGYPRQVSVLLTKLVTHSGRLPIGAPTSPAISNIVCRRMDKRFAGLGEKMGFDYSRYADDLTISSNNNKITKLIQFFKEIMQEEGFEVKEAKMRILRSNGRQKVTGIVVNKKQNIERKEIKKLRAVIHNCRDKDMHKEAVSWAVREKKMDNPTTYTLREFKSSLLGRVNFVKSVNPEIGEKLLLQVRNLEFSYPGNMG